MGVYFLSTSNKNIQMSRRIAISRPNHLKGSKSDCETTRDKAINAEFNPGVEIFLEVKFPGVTIITSDLMLQLASRLNEVILKRGLNDAVKCITPAFRRKTQRPRIIDGIRFDAIIVLTV